MKVKFCLIRLPSSLPPSIPAQEKPSKKNMIGIVPAVSLKKKPTKQKKLNQPNKKKPNP